MYRNAGGRPGQGSDWRSMMNKLFNHMLVAVRVGYKNMRANKMVNEV